ncbi:bacillithiol system redox-active protein YtxJ [Fulvivirgaceae bacterium BMA10]|uniref:Bacillithiol system redox-active protein YtxJ n=1 Tax=Splendidivirga corallicola TaxID=3051826 RepID=A0ABT8KVR4_9BACT|nr:bacillithiol system redox-active protein YtxJ [Fulvivirgaceae bacterium BMA10]
MDWKKIENVETVEDIIKESRDRAVLIFKHSTRCPISSMALDRLIRSWDHQDMGHVGIYYLDLIANRQISNSIANVFGVPHESPQVLLIKDGECFYDNSHMGINYGDLKERLETSTS